MSRSHGLRSSSCGSIQRQAYGKQRMRASLEPLTPNRRSTPDLCAALDVKEDTLPERLQLSAPSPMTPCSPSGKPMGKASKYLVPLPPQDAPCSLHRAVGTQEHEATTLTLATTQFGSRSAGPLGASVDMSATKFRPTRSAKLQVSKKGVLDLTRRLVMSVPRPLPLAPQRNAMSNALARLHSWTPQINPRVPRPSGMLQRIARLRESALRIHSELQKNRLSLQALRDDSHPNSGSRGNTQMLALPATEPAAIGSFSVTCDISSPIVARDLDVLDDDISQIVASPAIRRNSRVAFGCA